MCTALLGAPKPWVTHTSQWVTKVAHHIRYTDMFYLRNKTELNLNGSGEKWRLSICFLAGFLSRCTCLPAQCLSTLKEKEKKKTSSFYTICISHCSGEFSKHQLFADICFKKMHALSYCATNMPIIHTNILLHLGSDISQQIFLAWGLSDIYMQI